MATSVFGDIMHESFITYLCYLLVLSKKFAATMSDICNIEEDVKRFSVVSIIFTYKNARYVLSVYVCNVFASNISYHEPRNIAMDPFTSAVLNSDP